MEPRQSILEIRTLAEDIYAHVKCLSAAEVEEEWPSKPRKFDSEKIFVESIEEWWDVILSGFIKKINEIDH